MAYKADGTWVAEDDSVSSGVTKLMSDTSSPLMQQAKTQAAQTSNRRGLLNSSMATGAATSAMLGAAMPIASQEATQTAQKNLTAQTYAQNKDLQTADITSKEKIAAANVAAHDRQYAMAAIASANQNYESAFMNIAKEYNLPESARNAYTTHLGRLRDSDLNLIEQMYGVNLQWGSTDAGTTGGGASTLVPGEPTNQPLIP